VKYTGSLKFAQAAAWKITSDGNSNPEDGVIANGSNVYSPTSTYSFPTLSQWVLIVLALSVGGIFVWKLKRRKRTVVSVQ
jgi:hypothetical protein